MKKIVLLVLTLAVIGGGLSLFFSCKTVEKAETDPALKYILNKLSSKVVVEGFIPIAIMRYSDDKSVAQVGDKEVAASFAGSGTMVCLSEGNYCLVTCEHIYITPKDSNIESFMYGVRDLRDKGGVIDKGVVAVKPFLVSGGTSVMDIAFCRVELGAVRAIRPFSHRPSESYEVNIQAVVCKGKPEDLTVRSVVSGEKAKLLLEEKISGTDNQYLYVTDYKSIPGESGTGFVDNKGRLFVLSSSIEGGSLDKLLRDIGVIDKDKESYSHSYLIGPFLVNMN